MTAEMTSAELTNAESAESVTGSDDICVLLAGPDTLYFSCDAAISDEMRAKLDAEKMTAQVKATTERTVHCPEWLGARVCPQGARGGYTFLIETENFSVKLLGERIQHRPGVYIELRSYALHTHPGGPQGACEAALTWVRDKLFADQIEMGTLAPGAICVATAKLSRADIHIDWQGGYTPTLVDASKELRCFIRPGKTKWAFHGQGHQPTGYSFGKGHIQARIYNKTRETAEKANDAYAALLTACNGEAFDPQQDVWRLEFQLRREGVKGFKLYSPPQEGDDEAEIEAELAAEDLQHIGTLPRFFARMNDLFQYLTGHWLRLVEDNGSANRSRWPLHPTWSQLQGQFAAAVATTRPLDENHRQLVRGARYSGRGRILRRLALGVVKSLEIEDASPTSAALRALHDWVGRIAQAEAQRAAARCAYHQERFGRVPQWVMRGMGERWKRMEALEHRVQMLLGIFAAKEVLPLEFKPAYSVGDLLTQHLEELEREADAKGGVHEVIAAHFARVHRIGISLPAAA